MGYIIESDRSHCRGPITICPSPDRRIEKGELRLGVEVERFQGITWRHWTCCTSEVISNMKNALSSPEAMGGWNELREDDKERIRRAWEEGDIPNIEKPEPAHSKRPRLDENDVSEEGTEHEVDDEDADQDENTDQPEYTDDEAHHDENYHKENRKHQDPGPSQSNRKRKIADQPVSEE
ncbi:zf-PARP-domain-containing protein [Rhizopus microsporus var. microsporus]|uniref:Zf-PARP-domain-containing protein n=1 Tax=Rhizopus microsporus var. microsporus TaxID=86635 RepID=A0A1X0QSQ3_RHIZD|nr:zf-PARP-domain-containing protein [Rhizopus microsporus var. microsporus]